jgi:thiol-disulfide isomerase/thioredoxin
MTKSVVFLFFLLAGPTGAAVQVGDSAPAFGQDVTWIKGDPLPEFQKGRVYVVDLWGTWCPPCLAGIPHLKKLAEQYAKRDVTFVAVAISPDSGVSPEQFVQAKGDQMPYTVGQDIGGKIDERYQDPHGPSGTGSYPTIGIVDRNGTLAFIGRGYPIHGFEETLAAVVANRWDLASAVKKERAEAEIKAQSEPMLDDAKRKLQMADYEGGLAIFRKLLVMHPGLFGMRAAGLYNGLRQRASKEVANAWAKELVDKFLAGPDELLAWPLATLAESIVYRPNTTDTVRADADKPDFDLALRAANHALDVTNGKDPWRIQTLAMVTFSSGNRQRGLELMERSVEAAHQADWGAEEVVKIESMRDTYRKTVSGARQ